MIKAVLFDMDGVLIDTEKYLAVYKQKAAREAGYRLCLRDIYHFRSLTSKIAREDAKRMFGDAFDYDGIRKRRQQLMREHIETYGLEKKPFVREVLTELRRRGYQTAVVTATEEKRARHYLDMVGFTELFDEIISASMVENGKPFPDVYLYACRKIGRNPEECMAVEDSPNGVASAYSAGCQVTMVPDLTGPDDETAKRIIYKAENLRDLLKILP